MKCPFCTHDDTRVVDSRSHSLARDDGPHRVDRGGAHSLPASDGERGAALGVELLQTGLDETLSGRDDVRHGWGFR